MGKCIRCGKPIVSNNGICDRCHSKYEDEQLEYKRKRQAIQARHRANLYRLKKNVNDDESFPLTVFEDEQTIQHDLEQQKNRELDQLERQQKPAIQIETKTQKKSFDKYEHWLKTHNGDHRLWHNIHGLEPASLRTEYVEYKNGKLVHADICSRCGKTLRNCKCNRQGDDEPFNFTYGKA